MKDSVILWHRLDQPGHDAARISTQGDNWHLTGVAIFEEDQRPIRLDYQVICNGAWETISATVTGWLGIETVSIEITCDPKRQWTLNGVVVPVVMGCTDLDLSFSPATNLLPVRRLRLPFGQAASVRAAWLRYPHFNLEPLEQIYRRDGEFTYHYESSGGAFVADLQVNTVGFVTHYPALWSAETAI